MIPAIFDITKNTFNRHDEIFENILKYRKHELYQYYIKQDNNIENYFIKLLHTEELIHHEFNFIFKIANKHPKLIKKGNFIYLREILIQKSLQIGETLKIYKKTINAFNKLNKLSFYKDFLI